MLERTRAAERAGAAPMPAADRRDPGAGLSRGVAFPRVGVTRLRGPLASAPRTVAAAIALIVLLPAAALAEDSAGRFLGPASCSNPVCHGSLVPREGGTIPRNEYAVWTERDRHARAYQTLLGERSQAIAAALGIGPAHEAAVCLDCHATVAAPGREGEKFSVADGVSCESCHGAASGWIESHDDDGRSRADNVAAGLIDLADVRVRAAVCASCHVGDDRRFLSHRIMAAGHPRTSFELDTFTHLQPRHFVVDDDYRRRKGDVPAAVAWAVGQAAVLDDTLQRIAGRAGAGDGAWPEFALFDCFACHHPIRDEAAGTAGLRDAASLGLPGLLRASATMYEAAAAAAGLPPDARIDPSLRGIDAALALRGDEAARLAAEVRARVRRGSEALVAWKPSAAQLGRLLELLSSPALVASYRSYSDAEQATMAVQAVVASLGDGGALTDTRRAALERALAGLFEATRHEGAFRPETFAASMQALRTAR